MKNILITGASGFIGSFLVEEALKKNYRTFAGMRSSSSTAWLQEPHPHLHFLELDFSNEAILENQLKKNAAGFGRFDIIIHSAGLTKSIVPSDYFRVNHTNTETLVNSLIRLNLVPDKFILISSLAAYGPGKSGGLPIDTLQLQQPVTAYGKSKLAAEQFLKQTVDFPFIIINPTTVYGPREKDLLVLIQSINQHLELYIGSKKQQLSFIHVADVCKAVFLSIDQPIVNQALIISDTFNYAAPEFNGLVKKILGKKTVPLVVPVGIARLAAKLSDRIGQYQQKTPIFNSERLSEFEADNWAVDAKPLVQLGFTPDYPLEAGLKHTIDWYKAQGWIK